MSTERVSERGMSRVERRRASTRARIVEVAERLMRDRGVEAVTIQDITDAADVGHGTFYLHFKTKAEVLRPIVEHLSKQVHEQVDRAARGARDPALRMSLGFRVLFRAIAEDPLWRWYARSGMTFSGLVADMGTPPSEDLRQGLASGRFSVADVSATTRFIDGAMIGVMASLGEEGGQVDAVAETTAELVLRVLGVPADEAAEIARQPLDLE